MPTIPEILNSYNDSASLAEAETIPASWYTDHRIASLERKTVFSRSWQVAGRADQVSKPGDYLTANVAGEPVVVVRGQDDQLRAFFNVCRHHAAAVMTEPCGHATILRCPYHGWSYGLDGALKGVPEFAGVQNFDPANNGLVPMAVDTWETLIFVHLGSQASDPPTVPLKEFLGTMIPRVAPLEVSKLGFFERRVYNLKCNWKVYVDNYLDGGYHVPHLHKGLSSVLDYTQYTIENDGRYCLQSSPMVSSSEGAPVEDAATSATRTGDRAYYYWLYPNFMFNCYAGYMDTNLVLPIDTDHCQVIFDFYFADISESARARNTESVAVGNRVQDEDEGICESVQRGLKSRAYGAGRLSVRRETGEHLFHRLLAKDLRSSLVQPSTDRPSTDQARAAD